MNRLMILCGMIWLVTSSLASEAEEPAVTNLSAEVKMPDFSIRPPTGYTLVEQPGPGGAKAYAWRGATRPDNTSPWIMIVVMTAPAGETNMPPANLVLAKFLSGIERRREDWHQGPVREDKAGELTILESEWSGVDPVTKLKMHGFVRAGVSGRRIFEVSSQDLEPHDVQALKLAEASALTFKVRN